MTLVFKRLLIVGALGVPRASARAADISPLPAILAPIDKLDEQAPDLHWRDATGKDDHLAAHQGKAIVLHLWATWCTSCREELPALVRALQDTRGSVELIPVATDALGQQADVRRFVAQINPPVAPLVAVPGETLTPFLTWGVPVSYLIDASGRIKARLLGPRAWAKVDSAQGIAAFLGAAKPVKSEQPR